MRSPRPLLANAVARSSSSKTPENRPLGTRLQLAHNPPETSRNPPATFPRPSPKPSRNPPEAEQLRGAPEPPAERRRPGSASGVPLRPRRRRSATASIRISASESRSASAGSSFRRKASNGVAAGPGEIRRPSAARQAQQGRHRIDFAIFGARLPRQAAASIRIWAHGGDGHRRRGCRLERRSACYDALRCAKRWDGSEARASCHAGTKAPPHGQPKDHQEIEERWLDRGWQSGKPPQVQASHGASPRGRAAPQQGHTHRDV